jgi:hypothetical protein
VSARLQRHALGVTWIEKGGMARSAHALAGGGRVWLIDPFDYEPGLSAAAGLGELAGVLQLLDRHNRDCAPLAQRLGVPLAPAHQTAQAAARLTVAAQNAPFAGSTRSTASASSTACSR